MSKVKTFVISIFVCICLVFALFSCTFINTANADCAPKPKVEIDFKGLGEVECYATLLSEYQSTGPYSAWDGTEEDARYKREDGIHDHYDLEYPIWKAFTEYSDTDGYYFLQTAWKVNDRTPLNWNYFPPYRFKILLYFPEERSFVESGIYERYAFDAYYTVDMEGIDAGAVTAGTTASVKKSYNYTWEIVSLLARIVFTILIELLIALMFGYRAPKQIKFIIFVNTATQIILNVILNIANFYEGIFMFFISYLVAETIVFIIEAILYFIFLPRWENKPKPRFITVIYALVSNLCSFLLGCGLSLLIPGIL